MKKYTAALSALVACCLLSGVCTAAEFSLPSPTAVHYIGGDDQVTTNTLLRQILGQ